MDKRETSKNITVLRVEDTNYTADSVEWCPNAPEQNVFVCACYQLSTSETDEITKKPKRLGTINLYSYSENNGLKLHQIINNEAVLDQKWCHKKINDSSYLAIVSAKNTLEIYKLNSEMMELEFVTKISNSDQEILMLSLDWNTGVHCSSTPNIVTSDSKGNISIFEFDNGKLTLKSTWKAHDYEAWISAFYYWDPNLVFSGGDDAKLCQFDLRESAKTSLIKCDKYAAGVTSIHSNVGKEHILATGSYDTNLDIWDVRKMKTSVSNLKMPDSVWRVKWNPIDSNFLLTACMRGGFHIVDAKDLNNPEIVSNYYEHKDIAYGCDWKYVNNTDYFIIGVCSFYDQKMSIAKVNLFDSVSCNKV